jgi:hypothetical protein
LEQKAKEQQTNKQQDIKARLLVCGQLDPAASHHARVHHEAHGKQDVALVRQKGALAVAGKRHRALQNAPQSRNVLHTKKKTEIKTNKTKETPTKTTLGSATTIFRNGCVASPLYIIIERRSCKETLSTYLEQQNKNN